MTIRTAWAILFLIVNAAGVPGEEPKAAEATGRVMEGTVAAAERRPVEGAKILFGPADRGFVFVEGATATTDAQGRYRTDLTGFPWSSGATRALVLVPGFEADDRVIAAGAGPSTADFELKARPWKELKIRVEDHSGRPVAGVEVECLVDSVMWEKVRSDAHGSCQIAMAPEIYLRLSASPEGARPIKASLTVTEDGPDSITLPVLPPYRGRVVDVEGNPVPNVQIIDGWITDLGGEKWMAPSYRKAVTTDSEGRFVIPDVLLLRDYKTRTGPPDVEALCFADAEFRRTAFRLVHPTRAGEPIEVTLPNPRQIRVPVAPGPMTPAKNTTVEMEISILPQPKERPDQQFYFLMRSWVWKGKPNGASVEDVIEEFLPEGTYRLDLIVRDGATEARLGEASRELVVSDGEGVLELPPMELQPPARKQMAGKPAPEIDATELDTGRPVRLADFRGRVVVLDFWGYWCGPCTWNMPHLVDLQHKFAGRPLSIVALHDQSVQSRAAYDQKIATVRRRAWGGSDLPFHVLFDRPDPEKADDREPEGTGTTIKRYGLESFPTLFVIDADGTIVNSTYLEHDRLESLVEELVKKAEAR